MWELRLMREVRCNGQGTRKACRVRASRRGLSVQRVSYPVCRTRMVTCGRVLQQVPRHEGENF